MARSPELWMFILVNSILFIISSILMALTFLAYHQNPRESSYRDATIGFGFVVLGGLVEPLFRLGVQSNYHLTGDERLLLQSGEDILLALGLGLLFYAIMRYDSGSSTVENCYPVDIIDGVDDQWQDD